MLSLCTSEFDLILMKSEANGPETGHKISMWIAFASNVSFR